MPRSNQIVIYWLLIVCLSIFAMIIVGGVTRLTDSGLSMVEWRPLIGIVPPIGEAEWQAVFSAYKEFPQYKTVNHSMDLDAFKSIFYWEYGHRVLGRLIGIIYFVPFVLLLLFKKIPSNMVGKLWVGLFLGGLQGLMGWYMVKSGLVDMPRVSHYRLAAHLILAMVILCYLSWLIFDLWEVQKASLISVSFNQIASALFVLVSLQILYGAFVAGSRAGFGYNTFPLMNGQFMPEAVWQLSPIWLNWLENNAMLQFVHRWLGAAVLIFACVLGGFAWKTSDPKVKLWTAIVLASITLQFILGVLTLINVVQIELASLHQGGACVVLISLLCLIYVSRPTEYNK